MERITLNIIFPTCSWEGFHIHFLKAWLYPLKGQILNSGLKFLCFLDFRMSRRTNVASFKWRWNQGTMVQLYQNLLSPLEQTGNFIHTLIIFRLATIILMLRTNEIVLIRWSKVWKEKKILTLKYGLVTSSGYLPAIWKYLLEKIAIHFSHFLAQMSS